jgi:hypothetical protein
MKDLKQLVIAEAYVLREHPTQEERRRLNFDLLKAGDVHSCIYGQMTGSCFSVRADELILLCAIPYSTDLLRYNPNISPFSKVYGRLMSTFTALEFYIAQPDAQNATLIQFLRGERDSLTIQDL